MVVMASMRTFSAQASDADSVDTSISGRIEFGVPLIAEEDK
jgi:hypothetical protein